jgi:hypothetical protein
MKLQDKIALYEKVLAKYNEVMYNYGGLCSFFNYMKRGFSLTEEEYSVLYKDLCEHKGKRLTITDFIWTPFIYPPRIEYLQTRITKLKAELEE